MTDSECRREIATHPSTHTPPARAAAAVVLFDMQGWRLSHGLHLRKVHALVHTLQDHYPERLEAALLVRTPLIFRGAWALIKPIIDPVTAAKVHFLPTWPAQAEFAALTDTHGLPASLLPEAYSGTNRGPHPFPNLPGEPDLSEGGTRAESGEYAPIVDAGGEAAAAATSSAAVECT